MLNLFKSYRLKKEISGLQHCLAFRLPLHSLLLSGPSTLEKVSVFATSISSLLPPPPATLIWLYTCDPIDTALARAGSCLPILPLPPSSNIFGFFLIFHDFSAVRACDTLSSGLQDPALPLWLFFPIALCKFPLFISELQALYSHADWTFPL